MSCKYCEFDGLCSINAPDDGIEHFGIDDNGYCTCEDDESPSDTCKDYEEN